MSYNTFLFLYGSGSGSYLVAVLWILDILVQFQIRRAVPKHDPDSKPAQDSDQDPDPVFFVGGEEDARKKLVFFEVFLLFTFLRHIYIGFQRLKIKKKS